MTYANVSNSNDPKTILDLKMPSRGTFVKKGPCIRLLLFIQCEDLLKEMTDCLIISDEFSFDASRDLAGCLLATTEESYDVLVTDFCDFNSDLSGAIAGFKDSSNRLMVLFLMKDATHLDEIEYLSQGADSVILTPFKGLLILARIKAIMRWGNLVAPSSCLVGPFEFDVETKCLSTAQSGEIRLTDKEAQILQFLLSRKGRTVNRTDLLRDVWGYNSSANTHTVETHIYRLRKKIETAVDSKSVIITEAGGYRLTNRNIFTSV